MQRSIKSQLPILTTCQYSLPLEMKISILVCKSLGSRCGACSRAFADYDGMDKCYAKQLDSMYHVWEGTFIPSSSDDTFKNFGGISYDAFNSGLKVISINTVMYHTRNRHFKDDSDPCGQFAWLDQELSDAESNNQRVWIIGHIPPYYFFWYEQFQSAFFAVLQNHIGVIDGTFWGWDVW
jgi:hypothetical protein